MTPRHFVTQLATLRFADAFNPYADRCEIHDLHDAPAQRLRLLEDILEAATSVQIDAVWVGRDLGFRGGRRTGMALTDDVHFHAHLSRWGINRPKPTVGRPVSERTASVIWDKLDQIAEPVFLWNVFPLHPHKPTDPFTNRAHNARERRAGTAILAQLVRLLRPRRLIAVGNDAERALHQVSLELPVLKVRHPSYGGQADFARQIGELYGIRTRTLI